jgi:hypothetical protein
MQLSYHTGDPDTSIHHLAASQSGQLIIMVPRESASASPLTTFQVSINIDALV